MDKYYYLVSSLPTLYYDGEESITRSVFLEECRKWIQGNELKQLEEVNGLIRDGAVSNSSVINKWKKFERTLREELAALRQKRRAGKTEITKMLMDAMEEKDPLSKEKAIEKIKWDFLEDEEHKHMFDINRLVVYFLKVQILERISLFDKEKGKETFERLCEAKYE